MTKILFIEFEENFKLINNWSKNKDKKEKFDIFLIDNPKSGLKILEYSKKNDFDLVVINIDFDDFNYLDYITELRILKKEIPIIPISQFKNKIEQLLELQINNYLLAPYSSKDLDKIIKSIYLKKSLKYEKYDYELKIINQELNSFLTPFKEFSYYSETDLNGRIIDISQSFCDLIGYKKEELLGQKHSLIKHPLSETLKYKELWEKIKNGKIWTGKLRCLDKNNNDIWYKTIIFPKKNIKGEIIGYAAKRQNITELEILKKDLLTNLYNQQQLIQDLDFNKKNNLAIVGFEDFTFINDFYGHSIADNLIFEFSKILKNSLGKEFFYIDYMLRNLQF